MSAWRPRLPRPSGSCGSSPGPPSEPESSQTARIAESGDNWRVLTASAFTRNMPFAASASPPQGQGGASEGGYEAGVCNIGPEEIARRRRAGHVGSLATLAIFGVLVALHLPPPVRL